MQRKMLDTENRKPHMKVHTLHRLTFISFMPSSEILSPLISRRYILV